MPWTHITRRSCKAPAMLHVNQESREEGLKLYGRFNFDEHKNPSGITYDAGRYLYYNPMIELAMWGSEEEVRKGKEAFDEWMVCLMGSDPPHSQC